MLHFFKYLLSAPWALDTFLGSLCSFWIFIPSTLIKPLSHSTWHIVFSFSWLFVSVSLSHTKLWALGECAWDIIYLFISKAQCLASSGLSINVFKLNWIQDSYVKFSEKSLSSGPAYLSTLIILLKCSNNLFST